ncbi:MAG: hypothetical protein V4574_07260 [Pseudomonadota bacterium]
MGSIGDGAADKWRESAAFDVTVADYRRAFALAIADTPDSGLSLRALLCGLGGIGLLFVIMGMAGVALPAGYACSAGPRRPRSCAMRWMRRGRWCRAWPRSRFCSA